MTISAMAAGVAVAGLALQTFSAGLAAFRCRRDAARRPAPAEAPPVSLVQPLCGVEAFSRETLASIFALDYPDYEILFCLADPADPIAPLVRRTIAANPNIPARLLIGDERVSGNPKLNNVVKGWKAASRPWVIIADSNVLMPRDYIQRLMARWRADTGIVCAPPIGARPGSFAAE
ncbi:MAG TPA: glycosyltransferase, partial [Roseiarcus sp.]|nr:glycosyltransferase [Roseiarcus sp.]